MAARTPLFHRHTAQNARMVEFGGYEMPLQYSSIRDEHLAVRSAAGLFDLSHMGEVQFSGPGAEAAVQRLIANDVRRIEPGGALYGVMCNERGGIVDDVVVYRDDDGYMVVVNASCRAKDVAWMSRHAGDDTVVEDMGDRCALIAVQGPRAVEIVAGLSDVPVAELRPFHSRFGKVAGIWARISRTGYTGEDGFELYVLEDVAVPLWDALLEAGAGSGLVPCGLGARDTLRLEAGLRLYGQDMDENTDPYSCALGWTVKLDKGDFIGAAALHGLDPAHPPRRFVGLRLPGRTIARHGHAVSDGTRAVGEVTSGTFGFTLGCGIATASLSGELGNDAPLFIDIRGTEIAAERAALPFYRRPKGA